MVHLVRINAGSAVVSIIPWLAENQGCSVVFTPRRHLNDDFELLSIDDSHRPEKSVSIIICSLGRPESLETTLRSLSAQTCKDLEIISITEKGHLSHLRDKGLRMGKGVITSFIDDDVCCPPTWLESVVKAFLEESVVGVTGPTTITDEYRSNRDIFKYKWFKKLYDWLFLNNLKCRPSYLSKVGAPSTASNNAGISYEGEASYLEACNMSVRTKEAIDVGGFDHSYQKTSEWCEVDLALRLRNRGSLVYRRNCKLYHRPSKAGVYGFRLSTQHRWRNFVRFQRRWIKPSFKQSLYWMWVWTYLKLKEFRMI